MVTLLPYDELPPAPRGGRSGWGQFGLDDNLGSINLQTPQRIRDAAALITRGALFPLNAPVAAFAHEQWGRTVPHHQVLHEKGAIFFDDVLQNYALQGSSQWDSLGHVGYGPDEFYNGATESDILAGSKNTIDAWARRGIAGRGVLLDMVGMFRDAGRPYDPSTSVAFTVDDLEAARKRAGVEFRPGDIVMMYTGFGAYFSGLTVAERTGRPLISPGLEHSESIVRYLWNHHLSAFASDNLAVEAFPADMSTAAFPFGALHNMLIGQLGFALGELWQLDELAADCAGDGVSEMFVISSPINLPGGIGSPANVTAVK
jgi:kynurenine formamidase